MMAKSGKSEEVKYFIVQCDSLSMHGSETGSDKAEAERLLQESSDTSDLVVIRGVIHQTIFQSRLA